MTFVKVLFRIIDVLPYFDLKKATDQLRATSSVGEGFVTLKHSHFSCFDLKIYKHKQFALHIPTLHNNS